MKSREELLSYYRGVSKGFFPTSRLSFPKGRRPVHISDQDRRLDSALLHDADRLIKASLVSFLACNRLGSGGYGTWGTITLYYARFYSISTMLRLTGIATIGQRLLFRKDELRREYLLVHKNAPEAKAVGCGGGSHKESWRMFSRRFQEWAADESPGEAASVLGEEPILGFGSAWYETEVEERNEANYLKLNDGYFFPEAHFSGMHRHFLEDAKLSGNWDYLRTDANPYRTDEPPEAYFFKEKMAWDLIKYVISALVQVQGKHHLDEFNWLIKNLEANGELCEHVIADLGKGS